jgi:hypothetical protein
MKRSLPLAFLALMVLVAPALSAGAPDAEALLKRTFDNYRATTSQATVDMTIHRPDWERSLEMKSSTRGNTDALVRFLAPPKDAGNATLKLSTGTWVFNPKLNQVIQLPASMMAQSWMGSDFSYNDLAKSTELLTEYTHRIIATASDGGHTVWTIECDPKPGRPIVWGKVTIRLRDDYVVLEEIYFDQDMKAARTMTTDKIGPVGGRSYPLVMTMHPSDTPGSFTRIETKDASFNLALPDYLFTLSNLQNPRS